jgi:glucose-6-phosphate dehydrogenase assembly protein OpcA
MENVVTALVQGLLPDGVETTFPEIETTMAGIGAAGRSGTAARTATVVILGPKSRLIEVAESLKSGGRVSGIRLIFVASGALCTPAVRVTASEIALEGLRPEFVDNAVAALRLPSLPTVLWWRGGEAERLPALAKLVDRVVLDVEDPEPLWRQIDTLIAEGPVADLRWTALTRWRVLMAHFFDMPAIQSAAARLTRLQVAGRDRHSARLLAAWLMTSLKLSAPRFEMLDDSRNGIDRVTLSNDAEGISLHRLEGTSCVEGRAHVNGREASRVVAIGNQDPLALMSEELRVRVHDVAFESAVRAARTIA